MDLSTKEEIFCGHKKNTIMMIHTCLNIVLINCCEGVYLMMIKLGYSPSVTLKLVEGIYPQGKLLIKTCKPGFIGPLFLKIDLTFSKPVLGANN